jgi:hypothetical protein
MELESSYQLLGIVRDDGIRTYHAVEMASGQELQVHLFTKPDAEADRTLFKAIRALPVSKRRELLEIGMEGDLPYIVTEKLPESSTAREWLMKFAGVSPKGADSVFLAGTWKTGTPIPEELRKASHGSAPPIAPAKVQQPELTPDYTRVMRVPKVTSEPPPPPPSKPEPKPELVVAPPVEEADEFSRLFGGAPPVVNEPVRAAEVKEAGEFTRMFLAAQPAESSPSPAPPPSRDEPGEFTRLFLAGQPPVQPAPESAPAPLESAAPPHQATSFYQAVEPTAPPPPLQANTPPAVQPPPVQPSSEVSTRLFQAVTPSPARPSEPQPGEFTRMFPPVEPSGSPLPPATNPATPDPPAKDGPSEFTRFFQSPMYPTPAGRQKMTPSTPTPMPPQVSRPSAQPSEFTQMFGSPNQPPAAPAASISGASGSATGVFSLGMPSPSRAQAPPGGASGPGEFTRMMSAPTPATLGQAPAAGKGPQAQEKSNVLLYVAGGAVLLAIILIIVFFVLRH